MTPDAYVRHRIDRRRIRLSIPGRRGDRAYFGRLLAALDRYGEFHRREVNPVTGSVLLEDASLDTDALAKWAADSGLFVLKEPPPAREPFGALVARPVESASRKVRRLTRETIDLPGALFIALLIHGLIEIARGNLRAPPWYTAFWYAFGVYSKGLLDRRPETPSP